MITINLWFMTLLGVAFLCFGLGRAYQVNWKEPTGILEFFIGLLITSLSIILR